MRKASRLYCRYLLITVERGEYGMNRARRAMVAVLFGSTVIVGSLGSPSVAHNKGKHCTKGYKPCLHPASDYDCAGGGGDGPRYVHRTVKVKGSDPYRLDADNDGLGCED
jgi:hypothetical protein